MKRAPNLKHQPADKMTEVIIFAGSDAWSHAKEWQEWAGKHIAADNVPPVVLSDEHLKDITGYQIIDDSRQCVRVYRAGHITERSLTQIVTLLAVAGVKTVYEYAGITDTSPADLSDQLPRLKDEYERGESLVLPLKKKITESQGDDELKPRVESRADGVFWVTPKVDKQSGEIIRPETWLCSPLELLGTGTIGKEHYRVMRWKKLANHEVITMAVPCGGIGDRDGWRLLKDHGLNVTTNGKYRATLNYARQEIIVIAGPNWRGCDMWWPFSRKKSDLRNLSIDDFLALSGVPNTGSGEYVSAGTAESLPAVMNAVSVIAEAVATMPCYLYLVRNDKGREAREWLDSHPVDILLNEQPNSCLTPYQFKRTMMRHCLLNGNAYAVIEWGRDGQPKSLHPYAPGCVVPERTGTHKYRYTITEPCTGTVRTYLQEEVLHLRYASDDGFLGRSPVTICREALGLGLAQQRHGASIMKDGMMAAGIITSGEWLDGVKGKQALDALERYKGAKNAGKTPILEGGMDYRQLGMSNQDAEWLASRRFSIEDIARMFNVSPIFLQEYSNSTYSNFSEASRAFLTMTMRPWLANFEQQIKAALLVTSPVPGKGESQYRCFRRS